MFNVNTEKGKNILNEINKDLELKKVDTQLAFSYNHHKNVPVHKNREKFFEGISSGTINENNIIKYMNQYTADAFYKRVLRKLKRIIKKVLGR